MNEARKVKAVGFDLWETLLLEKDGNDKRRSAARCRSLQEALSSLGLPISIEEVTRAHNAMIPWLKPIWEKNEEATHLDHLDFILREASNGALRLRPEWTGPLTEAYITPLFQVPPQLDPEALPTLDRLRAQGKRLCLISNIGRTPALALRRLLAQEGLIQRFDAMLFSDEARIRKPSPRIFQIAAESLGVAPNEMAHVGDQPGADVQGAKSAGLRAILLSREMGHDREAEADPSSLIVISMGLGGQTTARVAPDATISSLSELIEAIGRLE